jgi:hypothetical protein
MIDFDDVLAAVSERETPSVVGSEEVSLVPFVPVSFRLSSE